ncbi:copper resistance protein CopC [Microbacterium sp. cx-59]|uniref:copper resistance CopC family protein n=1 Tax=Microbacterium sp. cx-59 TaxID=2891207 RepID=UPI0027E0BF9D|nr:copper resistance protein CopC [Microbacterium sp. cx-59]
MTSSRPRPARRAFARVAVVLALTIGAVALGSQGASAHDSLTGTTPAAGETAASITEVSQTFSENLIDAGEGNFAEVTGPDGLHYEAGCSVLSGPTITTPVALGPAGTYRVAWRAVSSDGHPIADEYTFEYAPPAGTEAATGSPETACAAVAAEEGTEEGTAEGTEEGTVTTQSDPDADAPTTSAAAPAAGSSADGLALGLGIGGVAVVIVAIAVVVILRSRRS